MNINIDASLKTLIIFIVAAILTPPDVVSQICLAVPMLLLYEGSIAMIKLAEKRKAAKEMRNV